MDYNKLSIIADSARVQNSGLTKVQDYTEPTPEDGVPASSEDIVGLWYKFEDEFQSGDSRIEFSIEKFASVEDAEVAVEEAVAEIIDDYDDVGMWNWEGSNFDWDIKDGKCILTLNEDSSMD